MGGNIVTATVGLIIVNVMIKMLMVTSRAIVYDDILDKRRGVPSVVRCKHEDEPTPSPCCPDYHQDYHLIRIIIQTIIKTIIISEL